MPLPSLYGIAPDWAPFALAGAEGSCVPVWWWLGFGLLMLLLVATDLLTVHRLERDPSMVGSAATVAVCCLLALVFNAVIGWQMGGKAALQFSTGYLLEWSLSMDNIFVFAVIFRYFQVPKVHQYRILHWGIVGAILTRLTFILAGAALISRFQFILPLLGLFLIYTAWQLARRSTQRSDPRRNLVFRFARRWLPLAEESGSVGFSPPVHEGGPRPTLQSPQTPESVESPTAAVDYGGRFLVRQAGRLRITPPLLVLLVVESTDVLFAVDSVPAIFGITRDPLPCLYVQRLCHPRPAGPLFPTGRCDGPVPLFALWPGRGAGVRRTENGRRRLGRQGGHARVGVAGGDCRAAGGGDRGLDAGAKEGDCKLRIANCKLQIRNRAIHGLPRDVFNLQFAICNLQFAIVFLGRSSPMKHSLVTGGAGFIGSHLVEALLARGDRVAVIDDESTGTRANLAAVIDHPRLHYVQGSVADRDLVRGMLDGIDEVYHLAAAVGVRLIAESPIHTIETNVYPMELLLDELGRLQAAGRTVPLVPGQHAARSTARTPSRSGAKTRTWFSGPRRGRGGPTARRRRSTSFWPWPIGASDSCRRSWAASSTSSVRGRRALMAWCCRDWSMRRWAAGRWWSTTTAGKSACFAHVSDVVRAVLALMDGPQAVGRVFNIGSDQPVSILELAQRVIRAVDPALRIEFISYAAAYGHDFEDCRRRVPDLARLRATIGDWPHRTLEETIAEVVAWKRGESS